MRVCDWKNAPVCGTDKVLSSQLQERCTCVLLGKALSSGCDAKRQAKRLLMIAKLNERVFVWKNVQDCGHNCCFQAGWKKGVCVASKCE